MPDPIKDLYNSLKSTKLFLDENDFRQQLNKSPKEVFNVVSKGKQTSGLFIDYDDFENATGLKKKISEKVSKTGGKAGTFAPLLEEEPPKKEKLTYSDIEQVFADVNKADKKLANLQKSQITSAGIGAAPAIIPQADIDAATKDLSLVNKRKAEVLGSYQKELAAPVSRLLQTGEYKNFFDGDVYNQGKARNFFREITKKYGGGEYLVDTWTAELKKQGQFEKDKPRFSNLFDEELSKVGFSTDSITKMKEEAGQKLFDRLAKNQYDNVDLIKKQTTEEADAVLAQAKNDANVTVQEFNGYVEGLNKRLAAGEITAEQAASMYDEGLKNVNSGIKAVNDNYLDLVRNINVRANKKFGRIETELKRIGQTISDADILKELPESDRNKIKNATEKAAVRLSKEKNDIKKAALSAFTKSVPGASEWASNLSDSFISGFNRGLANLGDYLHMEGANNKLVDFLRDRSSTADKFASPKYEWNKNEWLNRAITSTATSLGASAPALLPTLGVGLISGGVGALPVLATGTTSFAIENAQNAGQQYQQKLEETGDVNIARKSATDLFNKNTIALPFYFLGGLGDMMLLKSSGIKKKIAGFGLEQAEEVPTEYIQSYNEAVEGGYKKSITEYIKENPEIAVDTLVSTIGQGATMSSMGNAMASFSKKVPESSSQFFANIIQKEGLEFAQKVLEKYYTTGTIDKAQYESQKAILEQTAQRLGKIEELGVVSKPDTILINALSSKVSDLKSKIEAEKDESIKAIYQKQLNDANSDIAQLAENKLPYVSFTMPGGMGDVRVMTVKEFQALPESEANELIKNSDGVQVVNDDALNTSLADKKKQLGIPKDAPEGAYPNNEPAQPQVLAAPEIEAKKADIERRRQEEISSKGLDRLFPVEIDESTIEGKKLTQEKLAQEKAQEEINAKYDAELAALGVGEEAAPQVPAAPITKEEIKTEEDAIPEPSPEGVLQPEQERIGEEGGERRGVESPVERVAAAQEGKVEAAKKEIAKREKTYAPPEGRQLEVNKLVGELYKFNQQKRGRLGLKTIESLKKRNELLIEAKRLGFETKVDREGRIYVKKARAVDKSNSNMAIDSKFVPLEKRSEKLRNLYNKIQGLSQKYGWDFQSFMPNVIVGADGKKMNNKQIANALKDLENGIPSKGANLILNDLEAMAESGVIEVRDGQNLIGLPIDEFFKELERIAEGDIDRVLGEEVETLPEADLVKWFEEIEAEQQFESEIYEEPITPEALPEGGVKPEVKKEVPKPVRPTAAKPAGEAGRGAPPAEGGPKPTPTEEGEPRRLSGIKKGLVSKEVLEGVDLDRTGDKQLLMAGKQIIESGEVEPKLLIDKIIDEGRGVLSPAEVVALITYKADLDTKIEDLTAEIEQLEASGQEIGTKGVELKNLQVEQRNFEIAAVITAQQQSMSFRLRRWMLDRTYSLQQQIAQYKKANGGVISPEVLEQFEKMDAEIQELKKQIKEAEERKVDQEGQVAVENIVEDVKREDARTLTDEEIDAKVQKGVQEEINKIYEQLPAKRKSRADQAIAALERIQKRLRSKTYDASIGIPVAIIDMGITTIKKALKAGVAIEKAIELGIDKIKDALKGKPFNNEDKFRKDLLDGFKAEGVKTEKEVPETPTINEDGTITIPEKFLRDLVRKGINTIDGLTDAAFKELESQLPGLTKRQVRDAITQYGKTVNPSQDEVRQQLAAAKRLGRLISELEDLKSMSKTEFALKYFKKPTPSKITEAEKNLKKQINSLARDLKTDAQVLSQAKESAKKRIEELQRRLKEKDYASRPKPLVKADAELEILLGKKQALQDKFEEEKKKAELKNRTLGQRIEDIALEIFSGISRALVAGLDLSAAFVQGTRRVFTNPVMSAKAFAEGLRQFASPTRMERFMQRYKGTYNYSVARNSGLAISDVDGTLSAKEQIFVVQWANTIYDLIASVITLGHKPSAEFIKRINPLKASQRAFDGYMNYIRISSFEAEMAALKNMGYTPDSNPEVYKSAADFVNTATGRANMGPLEASSKWLSVIMFAPRKVASELKLYSPLAFLYYGYMPAPVRKRALIDFAKFSASVLVTHALVKAAIDTYGGDEEDYEDFWNSDSPNFLAFKIGDKRISFLGGIKSTIVFMSRLFGQDFVDQYGITTKFGERYGKKIDTKLDLTTQFLLGKASPGTGAIRDYLDKNPNYENDDEILQNLVVPMWLQDANELYKEDPIAVTAMFNMLAIIGANIRKVDMKQVQDQIIFKEKINKKEVKRVVKLTDAQKEEFQNIVKERAKIELAKIAAIVKKEKSGTKRAEYDKMAIDQAKKDAQEILEKRYIKLFRQFPVQEKEQEETKEKVKKKLK